MSAMCKSCINCQVSNPNLDVKICVTDCVQLFCSSAPHTQHSSLRVCQPVLPSLVTSLVLTRLDYGSVTLNGITKRLMDRLQSVLNAAARLVHNSRKYDRISPLLRDLHLLRVPERIKFRLAVLVFHCRNQTAPNYLARDLQ